MSMFQTEASLPTELPGPVKDIIPKALLMRTSCNFILFWEEALYIKHIKHKYKYL